MKEPSGLTDDELKATLLKHGVQAGPIVASTRALYEKKLKRLQAADVQPVPQADVQPTLNQYSDSEEEEEEEEETGSELAAEEVTSHVDQDQQESSQESVADVLKEMFPDAEYTPTGISATRRRPIKGAAGRPVQHQYHHVPIAPLTPEKQETQARRFVPLSVQVAVFLAVACLVYLIYAYVEDGSSNPFVALLDNLSVESDREEEGLTLPSETRDTPALDASSGQE